MQQYNVTGMSCAACSARVEKAVSAVPGVTSVSVSLLTNAMGVEGTASPDAIIKAVTDAGYGASVKGGAQGSASSQPSEDSLKDTETPRLIRRLISSSILTLILMYFSMGHMMWGWPIPSWFIGNHVAMGLVQLLLSAIIMIINRKFFTSGFTSLIHKAPNMDTLVALGSMSSFVWSVFVLFLMTDAVVKGDAEAIMRYMDQFYFESAAMILTLITVGKTLEAHSKGKTTDALKSLMRLSPKTAVLLVDGEEKTVPIEEVKKGDIFVVRPGESIPVDGIVLEGATAVNESALTGESIPVDKEAGDAISAATINQSGFIKAQAERVGEDTTLSQIIQMVSDAAATKAPIAKVADKVSGVFVPIVLSIALVTLIVWLLIGVEFAVALERAISVLVISCPCALGLATPVAIMVGNGVGARSGILFKTSASLEETGRVQIVALDKTGTITEGSPRVTDLFPSEGISKNDLLENAFHLEQHSEHPLAKAILVYGNENGVSMADVSDFQALPGNGLTAEVEGHKLYGGSLRYVSSHFSVPAALTEAAESFSQQGKTPLLFVKDQTVLGIIAVADTIKSDSAEAVKEMHQQGIKVVMLTGDNEITAQAIGAQAGVDEVIAGVLPDEKEMVIRTLKEQGKVAMVGDGINDAPALTRADIGIAIGAGADVAIDAADVVLMKSRLSDVAAAIRLSRSTLTNIYENLFWAFFYNAIGIPLAAGCYIALFGWGLSPMFGAAAMSLSSFCVVTNALRLNLLKIHSGTKDHPTRHSLSSLDLSKIQEALKKNTPCQDACDPSLPSITLHIEGMMCHHCENAVKKALENLDFIQEASADFEKGTCRCLIQGDIDEESIRHAIEEEDYVYLSMDVNA